MTLADLGETVAVNEEANEETTEGAAPIEAPLPGETAPVEEMVPAAEMGPAEGTATVDDPAPEEVPDPPSPPAQPVPVPTGRRVRSVSALIVAALLVAVGVFLTLGGVDALVGHGPSSSPGSTPADRVGADERGSARPRIASTELRKRGAYTARALTAPTRPEHGRNTRAQLELPRHGGPVVQQDVTRLGVPANPDEGST